MVRSETTNAAAHTSQPATDELLAESKSVASVTIESCESLLMSHGWGCSAMAHIQNGEVLYVVVCNRETDWIVGKGKTQITAWKHAVQKLSL